MSVISGAPLDMRFDTPLSIKTPDRSEASISSYFSVAGAGFEPATFGL